MLRIDISVVLKRIYIHTALHVKIFHNGEDAGQGKIQQGKIQDLFLHH